MMKTLEEIWGTVKQLYNSYTLHNNFRVFSTALRNYSKFVFARS